jgi:hypothetical protein
MNILDELKSRVTAATVYAAARVGHGKFMGGIYESAEVHMCKSHLSPFPLFE